MAYLKTFVLNAEMNIPLSLVFMRLEPEYGAAAVTGPLRVALGHASLLPKFPWLCEFLEGPRGTSSCLPRLCRWRLEVEEGSCLKTVLFHPK